MLRQRRLRNVGKDKAAGLGIAIFLGVGRAEGPVVCYLSSFALEEF